MKIPIEPSALMRARKKPKLKPIHYVDGKWKVQLKPGDKPLSTLHRARMPNGKIQTRVPRHDVSRRNYDQPEA